MDGSRWDDKCDVMLRQINWDMESVFRNVWHTYIQTLIIN